MRQASSNYKTNDTRLSLKVAVGWWRRVTTWVTQDLPRLSGLVSAFAAGQPDRAASAATRTDADKLVSLSFMRRDCGYSA